MPDLGPAFAATIAAHFKALVENGLERTEALDLTREYQAELFESNRGNEEHAA